MKKKTWILKNDLSRSPQAAFKMYACAVKKKPKHSLDHDQEHTTLSRAAKAPQNLRCQVKSQLKSLLKLLEQKADICIENN